MSITRLAAGFAFAVSSLPGAYILVGIDTKRPDDAAKAKQIYQTRGAAPLRRRKKHGFF